MATSSHNPPPSPLTEKVCSTSLRPNNYPKESLCTHVHVHEFSSGTCTSICDGKGVLCLFLLFLYVLACRHSTCICLINVNICTFSSTN